MILFVWFIKLHITDNTRKDVYFLNLKAYKTFKSLLQSGFGPLIRHNKL